MIGAIVLTRLTIYEVRIQGMDTGNFHIRG
jgi:hypothetical protein